MSREVESLVNGRVIGEGSIKEGGKAIKISGVYRKAALMQFANRCDDDGASVWVSVMRVAVWIECNERHGRRVLRSLEESGLVRNTGQVKVMENGIVMPIYEIVLSAVRKLPQARDALQQKAEAKRAKNDRDVEARRVRRATVARQDGDDNRDTVAGSRATVARSRATVPAKESLKEELKDLGSKEPKSESVKSDGKQKDGFALTPNAADPKVTKRPGKLPMKPSEVAVEFYDALRDSPCFTSLPTHVRARTLRKPAIEALALALAKHDRDDMARVLGRYYADQKTIKGGENAKGLQNIINDGLLDDLIKDAARRPKPASTGSMSPDEAAQRLKAPEWRTAWGEREDPIYDAGRALLAKSGGRNARA
jgi:hypothetical protein